MPRTHPALPADLFIHNEARSSKHDSIIGRFRKNTFTGVREWFVELIDVLICVLSYVLRATTTVKIIFTNFGHF